MVVPLTNCGDSAVVSNVQRLRECAGSWMSRTTTVGSPTTVPITRLSPAGTAESQWTAEAIVEGVAPAVGRAVVVAAVVADVVGVVLAVGVEPPHPATASIVTRAAAPARTA